MLNYLSNRDVAIVSEIAGTTRDVIEAHLNIEGYPVIVSDTAGIRESKDEIERRGIKLAIKKSDDADLNIVIIEPKSGYFTGVLKGLINSDKTILVVNKSDLGTEQIEKELKKLLVNKSFLPFYFFKVNFIYSFFKIFNLKS